MEVTNRYEGKRLSDFLLKDTKVGDIVIITSGGWNADACVIDDEDLFIKYKDPRLLRAKITFVLKDEVTIKHKEEGRIEDKVIWEVDVNEDQSE